MECILLQKEVTQQSRHHLPHPRRRQRHQRPKAYPKMRRQMDILLKMAMEWVIIPRITVI